MAYNPCLKVAAFRGCRKLFVLFGGKRSRVLLPIYEKLKDLGRVDH